MKAIVYNAGKSLTDTDAFELQESTTPQASGRDILVAIQAIAVNPVDTKIRQSLSDPSADNRILGWDATGIVEAIGEDVTLFKPGNRVFYAGDVTRPGCYASHQLVDERIVGTCPETLDFTQAAAMPLTSITAWEALFDRMKITAERDAGKHILIIGAAGGLGSVAIQLAKQVAKLKVVATASRDESRDWCLSMGADHVINHRENLAEALQTNNIPAPDYIFCLADTDHYFPIMADLIAPQGTICAVVSSGKPYDMNLLKNKSAGFVWEFMFTRPMMQTNDMIQQNQLLNSLSKLLDSGVIRSTVNGEPQPISVDSIVQAHHQLETGQSIGKQVFTGF